MTMMITHGSDNVFFDLGFPRAEAENLKLRSKLMIEITKMIEDRSLTPARAARLFGVSKARIGELRRGKIERFSIEELMEVLNHAGMRVSVKVQRARWVD